MHLYITSNHPGLWVSVTDKSTMKTRAGRTFVFVRDGVIRDTKVQLADDV